MRLLSFLSMVQITMAMLQPENSIGWKRIVNYATGDASLYNKELNLILRIHSCDLKQGIFSMKIDWSDYQGKSLHNNIFFLGKTSFDWSQAADSVAEMVAS